MQNICSILERDRMMLKRYSVWRWQDIEMTCCDNKCDVYFLQVTPIVIGEMNEMSPGRAVILMQGWRLIEIWPLHSIDVRIVPTPLFTQSGK